MSENEDVKAKKKRIEKARDVRVVKGDLSIGKTNTVKDSPQEKKEKALTLQRIEKLFRMFCIHKDESFQFTQCKECILSNIPYQNGMLCTAIWKDKVLANYKKN